MSQRELDARLRSWARSPVGASVPMELRRQVLDIPTTAPPAQRRRWLRFLSGSRPIEEARDELDDGQLAWSAVAIAPTRTRGVITMFSPVKIVAAAAVLALSVGIASLGLFTTEPQSPGVSEAATTEVTPVWTGDYFDSDEGLIAVTGSGRFGPGPGVVTGTVTMSDPRVSGDVMARYQWLCELNETCTSWGSVTLTNDDGAWKGDFVAFNGPAPGHPQNLMIWMNGTGAYEGLSHVVNFVGPMGDAIGTGQIIDAPLPPQVALDWGAAVAD